MHGHRRIKVGEFIGGINPKNAASWPNQCFFLSRQYDVSISKASSFLSFSPHFLLILLNCGEKKEAFDPRESWPSQELPGCWVNFSSPWMVVSGHQMVNTEIRLIILLQPKMEKLCTVSKNKTRSWLWLRWKKNWGFPAGSYGKKNLPAMQETWV